MYGRNGKVVRIVHTAGGTELVEDQTRVRLPAFDLFPPSCLVRQ